MPFLFEKIFFTTCTNKHCEDKKKSPNQKTKTQTIYPFYDLVIFLIIFITIQKPEIPACN